MCYTCRYCLILNRAPSCTAVSINVRSLCSSLLYSNIATYGGSCSSLLLIFMLVANTLSVLPYWTSDDGGGGGGGGGVGWGGGEDGGGGGDGWSEAGCRRFLYIYREFGSFPDDVSNNW